jgi:hypothetical protein
LKISQGILPDKTIFQQKAYKMTVNNKLDKSFGPVGSFAGILVFVAGICSLFFSLYSLFLVLIGAFVSFSYSSVLIDFDKKRIRFSNNLFGIIKTGQWFNVKPDMKIGIRQSNKAWRSYSGGNRSLDIEMLDFRLALYSSDGKMITPIKKTNSLNSAKMELEMMCKQLNLSAI